MKPKLFVLGLLSATLATTSQAACYTVFDGAAVLYRSTTSPVDLSQPYSVAVPARFGSSAFMTVSNDDSDCPEVRTRASAVALARPSGDAPAVTRDVPQGLTPRPASTGSSGQLSLGSVTGQAAATPKKPIDLESYFVGQEGQSAIYDGSGGGYGGSGFVHTGPRGGRYTITKSGNKSYIGSRGRR